MLSLLLVLGIIISVVAHVWVKRPSYDSGEALFPITITSGLALVLIGVAWIMTFAFFINLRTVEKQITNYESHIIRLETDVREVVDVYLEHEGIIFDKAISIDALLIVYPELKANTVIVRQIELMEQYRSKKLELENELANKDVYLFWLSFGIGGDNE